MASEKQKAASRANGAKSRGPVTSAGKLRSARNNVERGLLARTVVLDGESLPRFHALMTSLQEELKPETTIENLLIHKMAAAHWRLMRVWILENSAVSHEIRKQAVANALENMPTQAALAYRTLSDESRWLDVFSRYEVRFDRQLSRAIQRFNEVRAARKRKKVIFPGEPNSGGVGNLLSPEGID